MYYTLEGHEIKKTEDIITWGNWMKNIRYHVADEKVGDIRISTIFLGIAFNKLPLLFETMVFGGPLDRKQIRYPTWAEAEAGHKDMVRKVKAAGA